MANTIYVPALRFDWLTRLYAPLIQWALREREFKIALVAQASLKPNMHVLDVECGTISLAIQIKQAHPSVTVVGLANISSYDLPYPVGSFDRIFSSLRLHQLTGEDQQHMLREMYRVLRHGGELHIADWSKPRNFAIEMCFLSVPILDGCETTNDNAKGLLLSAIESTGFVGVHATREFGTVWGILTLFKARKSI